MTTATLAPKTTRSGRPKMPPLDKGRILTEQTGRVATEVAAVFGADAKDTAIKRLAKLNEVEERAHALIAENEPAMRKQALSLALHEGARSVYHTIGLSREAFSRMTAEALGDPVPNPKATQKGQPELIHVWAERPGTWDETVVKRATDKGVRFYRNAAVDLPQLALKVITAKARMEAVRPLRNELVRELATVHGLKRTEIAEIIGRTPSRVSHIALEG